MKRHCVALEQRRIQAARFLSQGLGEAEVGVHRQSGHRLASANCRPRGGTALTGRSEPEGNTSWRGRSCYGMAIYGNADRMRWV